MSEWRVIVADVLDGLGQLPDASVQCIVTSPPYWGLRNYGVEGQIGLEPTPEAYVERMVAVFREVRRVLRDDGTLWLNMGDGYAQSEIRNRNGESEGFYRPCRDGVAQTGRRQDHGLKPKDLIGMPWRLAFALQADGWWLRSDIIWSKPNPMPESVTDRPTKAHEYVFLLTKAARYFYDAEAVKEASEYPEDIRPPNGSEAPGQRLSECKRESVERGGFNGKTNALPGREAFKAYRNTRNRRTVWEIPTQSFSGAHFATFPEALVEPCIKAGTSERGCCPECGMGWERVVERRPMVLDRSDRTHAKGRTRTSGTMVEPPSATTIGWEPACTCARAEAVPCTVLDPFNGSGTTGAVAVRLGRRYVGIELNESYAAMAERRIGEAAKPNTYRDDRAIDSPLFAV